MKFTGQVKVPDVDHPGVPASFVVEEDHAEVLLDGETLGRWSLYDVQASRLIASAFSVRLGDEEVEEVTFIADDPIEFAYRGVEHMGERWARYKSMTFPRRMFAVAKSRRGATPSRIQDLREAMQENLDAPIPAAAPAESASSVVSPETRRAPHFELSTPVREPQTFDLEEPESRPRLMPGPGLMSQPVAEMEGVSSPGSGETVSPPSEALGGVPPKAGRGASKVAQTEGVASEHELIEPVAETEGVAPEPQIETPTIEEGEPVLFEDEIKDDTAGGVPLPAKDLIGTSGATNGQSQPPGLLVDLGEFEDHPDAGGNETPGSAPVGEPRPETEKVLAAASAGRSAGLLSAVRSAFVRGRGAHEHEFIEAPGGIGIVRHICSDCGHISISVSD